MLDQMNTELDKFRQFVYARGVLSPKTKFLMALSNCVALGCEPCMLYRFKAARDEFDCTQAEIEEAIAIAVMNAAGVTQAKAMAAWKKVQEESEVV